MPHVGTHLADGKAFLSSIWNIMPLGPRVKPEDDRGGMDPRNKCEDDVLRGEDGGKEKTLAFYFRFQYNSVTCSIQIPERRDYK